MIAARVSVQVRARGPEAWRWTLRDRRPPFPAGAGGWRDWPTWELALTEALDELERRPGSAPTGAPGRGRAPTPGARALQPLSDTFPG